VDELAGYDIHEPISNDNVIKLVARGHNYEEKHTYRILIGKAPGKSPL
jgi:hypothetical protein